MRNQLIHVSDLFPTLLSFAGVRLNSKAKLDGVDQSDSIMQGKPSLRNQIVKVDDVSGFGSRIKNNFKFVNGSSSYGVFDGHLAWRNSDSDNNAFNYVKKIMNSEVTKSIQTIQNRNQRLTTSKILEVRKMAAVKCQNSVEKIPCLLTVRPCLFDLNVDPCEENNLANSPRHAAIYQRMKKDYDTIAKTASPSRRKPVDPACDPKYFNNTWNWWQEDL